MLLVAPPPPPKKKKKKKKKSNGSNVKSIFLPSHIFRFVMSLSYLPVFQSIELCATSELRTQASQILSQKLGET